MTKSVQWALIGIAGLVVAIVLLPRLMSKSGAPEIAPAPAKPAGTKKTIFGRIVQGIEGYASATDNKGLADAFSFVGGFTK